MYTFKYMHGDKHYKKIQQIKLNKLHLLNEITHTHTLVINKRTHTHTHTRVHFTTQSSFSHMIRLREQILSHDLRDK